MSQDPTAPGREDRGVPRQFSLLVCYDIADDGRREDVSDLLTEYGPRVQYSVFESRVRGGTGVADLCQKLAALMDPLEDQIRVYNFGARQAAPTVLGSRTLEEWRDFVVL